MTISERAALLKLNAEQLNEAVRQALEEDSVTVAQARAVAYACRESEGWLKGVRELLELAP